MSEITKLTPETAFQMAQRVYQETTLEESLGPQILLTGGEIVKLFELLLKGYGKGVSP